MRILIVEDHQELREAISRRLRASGNSVDEVSTIREARSYIQGASYAVVILDRMLPDGDSITLLNELRANAQLVPVLLLTARDHIDDRVDGLTAGADDYLVKPFAMDELLARVGVLARRDAPARPSIIHCADVQIDLGRREIRRAGVLIPLRPKEYTLLELLASSMGRAVSREQILDSCWDTRDNPASNVEETVVASLRRKLGKPSVIQTVRGLGYMLDEPKSE